MRNAFDRLRENSKAKSFEFCFDLICQNFDRKFTLPYKQSLKYTEAYWVLTLLHVVYPLYLKLMYRVGDF